jgi:hypothetical protein
MDNTSFPVLSPQNFKGLNLSGMYVPAGKEGAAQYQAVMATPFQGPMHVHAIPFLFGQPQQTSRPQSPAGLATPGGVANV